MFVELIELEYDMMTQTKRVFSIANITSLVLTYDATGKEEGPPTYCAIDHSEYKDDIHIVGTVADIMNAITTAQYWHAFNDESGRINARGAKL